jgi:hypothetical protein
MTMNRIGVSPVSVGEARVVALVLPTRRTTLSGIDTTRTKDSSQKKRRFFARRVTVGSVLARYLAAQQYQQA